MIQVEELEFSYGQSDFQLRISNLLLKQGSKTALVGPSGCGKTTLLHLFAGIILPHRGSIRTEGVEIHRLSDADRRSFRITRMGLVFQEFELLDYLSVLDNIVLPYRMNSSLVLKGEVWSRAKGLAEEVGIGDKLNRHPRELSQGERQRVAVCRALLTEPAIVLADEPTGNLDPTNKGKVLTILLEYAEQKGATLVTVTHDYDLLEYFQEIIDFKEFYGTAQTGVRDTAPKEAMVLD